MNGVDNEGFGIVNCLVCKFEGVELCTGMGEDVLLNLLH